ncbi:hypothetical protein SGLAM104S_00031 [Streptomyces glaucescens]
MGTVRITDANRLSIVKPGLAETLNVDRSGITADSLTVASNRRVWWNCPEFPEHEPWKAVVNNRTGGFRKRYGTGCPTCRLRQTSVQELRLKAELSTVLAIDVDRDAVHSGRVERVDMVVNADGLMADSSSTRSWTASRPGCALVADHVILADRLWATVLLHRVRAIGDGPIDRRLNEATTPVALNLLDLTATQSSLAPEPLTVAENPSALEAAMERAIPQPMACTHGLP